MTVNKIYLLAVSGIVWIIAGFNVFRIGFINYALHVNILNIVLSALVFFIFLFMIFSKLVNKHEQRIMQYKSKEFILKFFDKKSYILMFCMISVGIILRQFLPIRFIAVFYSGLGLALAFAGIKFLIRFFVMRKSIFFIDEQFDPESP